MTIDLYRAIAAAQADARTLHSSEPGTDDPHERAWYYPPSPAVRAEVQRLCARHGLAVILRSATAGPKGQVCTTWAVIHFPTGQEMVIPWDTEPMPDLATKSHGVGAAVRHAARFMPLVLFSIPARPRRRGEKVDEAGAIVSATHDAEDDLPAWAGGQGRQPVPESGDSSDGTGSGLVDPGPLGGEDPVETDHDPEELAAEADAAARGEGTAEGVDVEVDAAALMAAVKRWGQAHQMGGKGLFTAALRAAHGEDSSVDWSKAPITKTPAAQARRERLIAFLRDGRHL